MERAGWEEAVVREHRGSKRQHLLWEVVRREPRIRVEEEMGDVAVDDDDYDGGAAVDQEEERNRRRMELEEKLRNRQCEVGVVQPGLSSRHNHLGAWEEAHRSLAGAGKDFAARTCCSSISVALTW